MSRIILNKLDYLRIQKRLIDARQQKTIDSVEAEKLSRELESATLLEPQEIPADLVTMNSVVRISFEGEGKPQEFKIVYPEEADFKARKVSIFSPVATALIGFRVGDLIEWMVPGGLKRIRIDGISYQPEATGNYSI